MTVDTAPIFYDFFGLLTVPEPPYGVVILFGVPADNGTVAPGADFRQLGILLYFLFSSLGLRWGASGRYSYCEVPASLCFLQNSMGKKWRPTSGCMPLNG